VFSLSSDPKNRLEFKQLEEFQLINTTTSSSNNSSSGNLRLNASNELKTSAGMSIKVFCVENNIYIS
jgi:hypothetical protein